MVRTTNRRPGTEVVPSAPGAGLADCPEPGPAGHGTDHTLFSCPQVTRPPSNSSAVTPSSVSSGTICAAGTAPVLTIATFGGSERDPPVGAPKVAASQPM